MGWGARCNVTLRQRGNRDGDTRVGGRGVVKWAGADQKGVMAREGGWRGIIDCEMERGGE